MQKAVLTILTEMCVIKTSLTGYIIALVGPTVVLFVALYLALTSSEPPLTDTQKAAFETLGASSASGQRAIVAVGCIIGLSGALPAHFLLLRECLFISVPV